jgi:hypothetical protein
MFSIRFPAKKKNGQRKKGSMVFCAPWRLHERTHVREREQRTRRDSHQKHSVSYCKHDSTTDPCHSRYLDLHMAPHSLTTAQHDRRLRRRQYYLKNRQRALFLAHKYYRKHRVQVCANSRRRYNKLKALYAAHMAGPPANGAPGASVSD